jgi:sugar phosphate isomerase/epimerase
VKKAAPYLKHVHVCDSGRMPPGLGTFDFDLFGRALRNAGYDSFVSAEVLSPNSAGMDLKTAAAVMKRAFD